MRRWSWVLLLAAGSSCSAAPTPTPTPTPAPAPAPAPVAAPSVTPTSAEQPNEPPPAPAPSASAAPVGSTAPAEAPFAASLPPEVIQRIVRQNFGSFRLCYENSLRNSPNLQDRVVVRFAIGKDGAVTSASAMMRETTMWNKEAIQCVVDAMKKLRFPMSAHGVPSVTYPIAFSPGS